MKYFRTYHFPFSPGATSDDKISSDMSCLLGKEIVLTEKLDGSNTAICKNGVYARSHSDFSSNPWDNCIWDLYKIIERDLNDEYIFGENMYAIHSIEYKQLKSYFYMFGVRKNNEFLSFDDILEYSYLLDIPTAPVLFRGIVDTETELKELVLSLLDNGSAFDGYDTITGEPVIEGLVARISGAFNQEEAHLNVLKYVRESHVKTDTHWTRNWKPTSLVH